MPKLLNSFFPPEVVTLFSDRTVDFRLQEDQRELAELQKDYLLAHLGSERDVVERVVVVRQVHGDEIVMVGEARSCASETIRSADAMMTNLPHVPLTVRTADCLPVFIFDPVRKAIGLVHAGWKGSQKEIVVKVVRKMMSSWGCRPADLRVALGPAIRSCCYQVGKEFENIFPDEIVYRGEARYLDLVLVNRKQLLGLGIREDHIQDCRRCTCCDPECFSYRREGADTGRHISVMMLKQF